MTKIVVLHIFFGGAKFRLKWALTKALETRRRDSKYIWKTLVSSRNLKPTYKKYRKLNQLLRQLLIDTVSNLAFWSCLVNKLEPWHIVQHYATSITKHSNLNSIDRLQFPWLTVSIFRGITHYSIHSIEIYENYGQSAVTVNPVSTKKLTYPWKITPSFLFFVLVGSIAPF